MNNYKAGCKFAIYCAQVVLSLYECKDSNQSPRKCIETAQSIVDNDAVDNDAYVAARSANIVSINAAEAANSAAYAAHIRHDGAICGAYHYARVSADAAQRPDLITKMQDELKRVFESIK